MLISAGPPQCSSFCNSGVDVNTFNDICWTLDMPSDVDKKVLDALRAMPEKMLHADVVHPLLRGMGATHIEYTHGSFERGKDFKYLAPTIYGKFELTVCQVKNEKLSGSASKLSQSTTAFLNQALTCKKTEVLSPLTHRRQAPDRVVLITTYAIPDAATSDANPLLTEIASGSTIIGPSELTHLLKTVTPEIFAEIASPGNALGDAVRRLVALHTDAAAFELPGGREIKDFYINVGLSNSCSAVGQLIAGSLSSTSSGTQSITEVNFSGLWHAQKALQMEMDLPDWITLGRSAGDVEVLLSRPAKPKSTVVVRIPSSKMLREATTSFVRNSQEIVRSASSIAEASGVVAATLSTLSRVDQLIKPAARIFEWRYRPSAEHVADLTVFRESPPAALLQVQNNLCVTGDAGAGKTCLARMLALAALDNESQCIYFPCAAIKNSDEPLREAIRKHILSLPGVPKDFDALSAIRNSQLIIIDGCDEAATLHTRLARDLLDIATSSDNKIDVTVQERKSIRIPQNLKFSLKYELLNDHCKLTAIGPLTRFDCNLLIEHQLDPSIKQKIGHFVEKVQASQPKVVATTRSSAIDTIPSTFMKVALRPFDKEQLHSFFRAWCHSASLDPGPILDFLKSHKYVSEICATPLHATIVASAFENGYDLPSSLTEVYRQRFELLLDRWDRIRGVSARNKISKMDKYRLLSRLAFELHQKRTRYFSETQLGRIWEDGFAAIYKNMTVGDVLTELRYINSMVYAEGNDRYNLGHLSFQEFLVAHAIVGGQYVDVLVRRVDDPWWHRVALFYAGISGDISRFMGAMQRRGGLRSPGTLLDEMMKEARYTSQLARSVFQGFKEDGMLDFESPELDFEESEVGDDFEQEIAAVEAVAAAEIKKEMENQGFTYSEGGWRKEISFRQWGRATLVIETPGDDAQLVDPEWPEVAEKVIANKCLQDECSLLAASFLEDILEENYGSDMVAGKTTFADDEGIRANLRCLSVLIPPKSDEDVLFEAYFNHPDFDDGVIMIRSNRSGKLTAELFV